MATLVIGIAGGMGAGKSALAARLSVRFGARSIAVDDVRRSVGGSSPDGVAALWDTIREATLAKTSQMIAEAPGVVLLEWAMLAEDGFAALIDKAIVAECPRDERLRRLAGGDLTTHQIIDRMDRQAPDGAAAGALRALGIPTIALDTSAPLTDPALFDAYDELTGAEFSSSSSFCLFRIPRRGGRVIWEVTNSCNYGCRYCIFSSTPRKPEGELSTERALGVVDELADAGFTHIKFTGGEPMLRPDLLDILSHARARGLKSDLSTNASLIDEAAASKIKLLGLDMVHVSLDGHTQKIQESARGARTYAPTVAGIKALVAQGIPLRVGCVVFKGNQDHLMDIAAFCHQLGCGEIIFSLMEPAGRMKGQTKLLCDMEAPELLARIQKAGDDLQGKIKVVANLPQPAGPGCGSCPGGERFLFINHKGMASPCTWVSDQSPLFDSQKTLRDASLSELLGARENTRFKSVARALCASGLDRCPMKSATSLAESARVQALFDGGLDGLAQALAQGGRFSELSPIYAFSNESIAGWMPLMKMEGKRVLTVGGSGDQMICAYMAGASHVSNFDVNLLARFMAELKLAMLARLSRAEFQAFFAHFGVMDYQGARERLSLRARHFFDLAYQHAGSDGALLAASGLLRPSQDREALARNIPYLFDDQAFERARAACNGKTLSWTTESAESAAREMPTSGATPFAIRPAFDAIILSNVADYAPQDARDAPFGPLGSFCERVARPLSTKLAPGGRMLVAYAYASLDPAAPHRSAIDDADARAMAFGSRTGLDHSESALPGAWSPKPDRAIFWDKSP